MRVNECGIIPLHITPDRSRFMDKGLVGCGLWVVGVLSETVEREDEKIREGFFASGPASLETIRMGDTVGHLPVMGRGGREGEGEGEGNLESN